MRRAATLRAGFGFLALAGPCGPLAAQTGLPDGGTARASGSGIVQARYIAPTTRYAHGVLGDAIEAGGLEARDAAGRRHILMLPDTAVFEDITPRLADLDGDGAAEVVVVLSYRDRGAALAVYGLRGGEFVRLAETEPIGQSNRWLNPAAIADFTGDGQSEIAIVRTPHIGGRLELYAYRSGSLRRLAAMEGFSNHVIGSRVLNLAVAADVDGDGISDLVLPDRARTALVAVSFSADRTRIVGRVAVPSPVAGPVTRSGSSVTARLADGRRFSVPLAALRP